MTPNKFSKKTSSVVLLNESFNSLSQKVHENMFFTTHVSDYSLKENKIVDNDWEYSEKPQDKNPIILDIKYKNGIHINSDVTRFMFEDQAPSTKAEKKKFAARSKNIIKLFPKELLGSITAVGVNHVYSYKNLNLSNFCKKYLDQKILIQNLDDPTQVINKFTYKLAENLNLNLTLINEDNIFIIDFNFHHEIKNGNKADIKHAISYIDNNEIIDNVLNQFSPMES